MKKKLLSILSSLESYLTNRANNYIQHEQAKKAMLAKSELNNLLYNMMLRMRDDLYLLFQYDTYNLSPVIQPTSIRIFDYSIIEGTYHYYFAINKKSYDTIPNPVLKELTERMNYNIMLAHGELANNWGYNVLYYTHPFLASGMWVTSIQDNKMSEVHIIVQTNITPQEFKEKYHQPPLTFMTY